MELVYSVNKNTDEIISLNNASVIGNGERLNITDYSSLVINVTGKFVGRVSIGVRINPSKSDEFIYATDINTGEKYEYIDHPGVFIVKNLGYNSIFARLSSITSGSVTVKITSSINLIDANRSNFLEYDESISSQGYSTNNFNIINKNLIVLNFYGEFDAEFEIYGKTSSNGSSSTKISSTNNYNYCTITSITKPGIYFIQNDQKFNTFYIYSKKYTSGVANINIKMYENENYDIKKRNIILGIYKNVHVTAGSYIGLVDYLNIDMFPFQYISIKENNSKSHHVKVTIQYSDIVDYAGITTDEIVAIDEESSRSVSNWIDSRGTYCANIWIYNNDIEDHDYTVILHGVR